MGSNRIGPHGEGAFEKRHVGEEDFLAVLDDLLAALRASGAPFAFIGGIASAVMGRPRPTLDVDVIFLSTGDLYLDDEMLARVRRREFMGRMLPIVSPEDLVIMKALAHSEETPRYWYDGLSLVARSDLDWGYLLRRARHGPRCVLSFLLFARTAGLVVPADAVRSLRRLVATGRLAAS